MGGIIVIIIIIYLFFVVVVEIGEYWIVSGRKIEFNARYKAQQKMVLSFGL